MLTNDELRAIQARPYEPWTPAQRQAHAAALANGWTAESANSGSVTYRRGTRDYVTIEVVAGPPDLDDGHLTGNGRIIHAAAPHHYFARWASVTAYLDRPKGRPYRSPQGR
jgi:hypothetical protein